MNDDRWYDLKDRLEERFPGLIVNKSTEESEDDVGHITKTEIESLEFQSEMGHLKIERISRPKIIDKKAHYHKGAGVAKVEFITSDTEKSHKLNIYKENEAGEWELMDLPAERLSF